MVSRLGSLVYLVNVTLSFGKIVHLLGLLRHGRVQLVYRTYHNIFVLL